MQGTYVANKFVAEFDALSAMKENLNAQGMHKSIPTTALFDRGRCTSMGRKCDGYAQDASSQILVPSQSSSILSTVPVLSGLGDSVLYLEFYHHCAGPTLASNFDREFWSRIVLQMGQLEPAIRHAVIALGYLVKKEPGSLKHARSVAMTDKTLLLYYNRAVRHLVDRMAESSYSVEVGLVACLLFICIEFLRGDYYAALTHLHSGLKIIAEWRRRPHNALQGSSPSPSSSIVIGEKVVGPRMISDNIVPMFIRAMATGLMFGAPFEPLLENFAPRPQKLQSRPFASVLEAQSAIYELRNATVILISVIFRKLSLGTQPTTTDLQNYDHLLGCHDSWFRNLQILERDGKLSSEDNIVASSLKVSHYVTYIALAGAIDIHQTSFDVHISGFKAINYHAKIVLDSMDSPIPSPSASRATPSSSTSSSGDSEISTPPSSSSKQAAAHFTFESSLIFPLVCKVRDTNRKGCSSHNQGF